MVILAYYNRVKLYLVLFYVKNNLLFLHPLASYLENYTNIQTKDKIQFQHDTSEPIEQPNDEEVKECCSKSQFIAYRQDLNNLSQFAILLEEKLKIEQGYNLSLSTKLIAISNCMSIVLNFIDKIFNEKKVLYTLCKEMYSVILIYQLGSSNEKSMGFRKGQYDTLHHQFIKDMTIKGLEPHVEKLIIQHNQEFENLKSLQELKMIDIKAKLKHTFDEEILKLRDEYQVEMTNSREKIRDETLMVLEKQIIRRENALNQHKNRIFFLIKKGNSAIFHELQLINSELIAEKDKLMRDKNDLIYKFEALRKKIYQEINKNWAKEVIILSEYWQKEINFAKIQVGELYRIDFEKKEMSIIDKCKRKNEENIEIVITKLEEKFNEIRFKESVRQGENNRLLKINYERQLSELLLKNQRTEIEYADLCSKYERLQEELEGAKVDLISNSEIQNLQTIQTDESSSVENVYLENKHLKHYIRELESKLL